MTVRLQRLKNNWKGKDKDDIQVITVDVHVIQKGGVYNTIITIT